MRQGHLVKTITHSWRIGAKIMKQSKHASAKQTTAENHRERRKGEIFSALTRKIDIGLPALL